MTDERLELRYIPLAQARRWDQNPKKHDLDALVRSITTHGFGDPPKFDTSDTPGDQPGEGGATPTRPLQSTAPP